MDQKVIFVERPKKNKISPLSIQERPLHDSPLMNKSNNNIQRETTIQSTSSMNSARAEINTARSDNIPLIKSNNSPNIIDNTSPFKISPKKKSKVIEKICGRVDALGYPIIKGGKNHKVTFKQDMVKTIKVESYKKYNGENAVKGKDCLKCLCLLF